MQKISDTGEKTQNFRLCAKQNLQIKDFKYKLFVTFNINLIFSPQFLGLTLLQRQYIINPLQFMYRRTKRSFSSGPLAKEGNR